MAAGQIAGALDRPVEAEGADHAVSRPAARHPCLRVPMVPAGEELSFLQIVFSVSETYFSASKQVFSALKIYSSVLSTPVIGFFAVRIIKHFLA